MEYKREQRRTYLRVIRTTIQGFVTAFIDKKANLRVK